MSTFNLTLNVGIGGTEVEMQGAFAPKKIPENIFRVNVV